MPKKSKSKTTTPNPPPHVRGAEHLNHRVRGGLGPFPRLSTRIQGQSMAIQEYKDECDINNIVNQFTTTGTVTHVNRKQGYYGHVTGEDFSDAMRVVTEAQIMFDDLPSEVRKNFGNDPAALLDFVEQASPEDLRDAGLTVVTPEPAEPSPTAPAPLAQPEAGSEPPAEAPVAPE